MPIDMPLVGGGSKPKPGRPKAPAPKGGKPGAAGPRLFGYPWYVVVGGAVAAIVVGLYLRKRFQSASGSTTTAPPVDTSGTSSDGSGGSGITSDTGATNGADTSGGLSDTLAALQLLGYGIVPLGGTAGASSTGGASETAAAATPPAAGASAATPTPGAFISNVGAAQVASGFYASASKPQPGPQVFSNILGEAAQIHPTTSHVIDHPAVASTLGTTVQVKAGQSALNPGHVASQTKKALA